MSLADEDKYLAQYCRTGDPRALAELYDQTATEVLRVALHLTRSPNEAEDLVQACFLAVIENASFYDPSRPARPWLMGILANQMRRVQQRRARTIGKGRRVDDVEDPLANVEAAEFTEAVDTAITVISLVYQPVLRLHLKHGMSAAEIAHALNRPPGTVRTQIVRGLEVLRRALPASFVVSAMALLTPACGLAQIRRLVLKNATGKAGIVSLGGVIVMKKSLFVLAASLLLLGTLFWAWRSFSPEDPSAEFARIVEERFDSEGKASAPQAGTE